MSKTMLDSFAEKWAAAGRTGSVDENDNNYTMLGQGNTIALVGAHLTIDVSKLPQPYRHGVFAENRQLPAIVRFFDIGPVQLASSFTLHRKSKVFIHKIHISLRLAAF